MLESTIQPLSVGGEKKLLMTVFDSNRTDALAAIQTWTAQNETLFDRHSLFADLQERIALIEKLQKTAPSFRSDAVTEKGNDKSLPSLPEMMVTVQIDRCSALIDNLQNRSSKADRTVPEKSFYPSLFVATVQYLVHLIVVFKNRCGIATRTYHTMNLLHVCYIKSPVWVTRMISRLLPRLW